MKNLFLLLLILSVLFACERKSGHKIAPKIVNKNALVVDYKPLSKNINDLGLLVDENINEEVFPISIEFLGIEKVEEWRLFSANYDSENDLNRDLNLNEFRHSTLSELIAFKTIRADSLKNAYIVSMGSISMLPDCIACLRNDSISSGVIHFKKKLENGIWKNNPRYYNLPGQEVYILAIKNN